MQRAMGRWSHTALVSGWRGWLEMLEEKAAALQSIQRALNFGLHRSVQRRSHRGVRMQGRLASKADLSTRSVARMRNSHLSRGYYAWSAVAAKAALTQKLRHGVGYLVNRKTALVLAAWKRGLPRTKDLGGAASRFFADRHLSRAYEGGLCSNE